MSTWSDTLWGKYNCNYLALIIYIVQTGYIHVVSVSGYGALEFFAELLLLKLTDFIILINNFGNYVNVDIYIYHSSKGTI